MRQNDPFFPPAFVNFLIAAIFFTACGGILAIINLFKVTGTGAEWYIVALYLLCIFRVLRIQGEEKMLGWHQYWNKRRPLRGVEIGLATACFSALWLQIELFSWLGLLAMTFACLAFFVFRTLEIWPIRFFGVKNPLAVVSNNFVAGSYATASLYGVFFLLGKA